MKQQQRRVDLVGIEQRALVHIQAAVAPGVAVGHAHLAIVVAPVALPPVAGMVGYSRMAHGTGENVGNGLQILGHETAIRGAHATYLRLVDEGLLLAELLHALDDVA